MKSLPGDDARPGMLPTLALLIPSLRRGGAERQLVELALKIDNSRWRVVVVVLSSPDNNSLEQSLNGFVEVIYLPRTKRFLGLVSRLKSTLEQKKVTVVNCYLVSAQIYVMLARLLGWRGIVVFGVRDSIAIYRRTTFYDVVLDLIAFNPFLTPNIYIFNSNAGLKNKGYFLQKAKTVVIHNAIDTDVFKPDLSAKKRLLREIGTDGDPFVVGLVANLSVYKDAPTFIKAARNVREKTGSIIFVVVGDDRTVCGQRAKKQVAKLELESCFHFMGARTDVDRLLPGLDLLVSSSITEGFSNSIAEAMSAGVFCVVTDVGDSAVILGNTGIVVRPKDDVSIAEAILSFASLSVSERRRMGSSARKRIIEEFSYTSAVEKNMAVYKKLLLEKGTRGEGCAC